MRNSFCWKLCGALLCVPLFSTTTVAKPDHHQSISSRSKNLRVFNRPGPLRSLAGNVIEFRQFRDHLVIAGFSKTDESTCAGAQTAVGLSDNDPVLNQGTPGLFLLIWQFDLCTFEDQLYLETRVPIPTSDLEISPSLRSATLNTSVPVCDVVSGNCFDVLINLTWTAEAPLLPDGFHTLFVLPGQVAITQLWNSFMRVGQVSGSITNGSADYTWPGNSSFGALTKTVRGFIVIQIEPK